MTEEIRMYDYREWKHVFKLDPNKEIDDQSLEEICESGTDAILVGGTDGISLENVINLMARIRKFTVPCVLEVSSFETIAPGFDLYFIPSVLNSPNREWIIGQHQKAIKEYSHFINWKEVVTEGYCILNGDSKAAKLTNAITNLDEDEVAAYAILAEKMLKMPIFYLEYSGAYGDPELVRYTKNQLEESVLFYGGGIRTAEQAAEMKQYADVIVIGNVIYEDLQAALKTVQAVKEIA